MTNQNPSGKEAGESSEKQNKTKAELRAEWEAFEFRVPGTARSSALASVVAVRNDGRFEGDASRRTTTTMPMEYEMSDETKAKLAAIDAEMKAHGRDGNAVVDTIAARPSVVFWDEETGQWLHRVEDREEGVFMFGTDAAPQAMQLAVSWDEYEVRPVEETRLHHAAYGLDQARDGYGV